MIVRLPLDVSILISARNEEKNIPGLLVSLANQTARDNITEILIADNNSTDRTREVSEQIAETYDLPLRVISLKQNNLGDSRRQLVNLSSSDYLVFIDADCKVEAHWLQTLISHFSSLSKHHPKLAGVGGPNRLPEKNLFQKMINQNLNNGLLHGFSAQAHRANSVHGLKKDHLPTTNALLKKSAVMEAGNFSPRFHRVGEDLDMGLRMTRQGHELRVLPHPEVINDCAQTLGGWLNRMFRFGQAQGLTFGMRFGAVTACVLLMSALLVVFPFMPSNVQGASLLTALIAVSLISKPVTFKSWRLKHLYKGTLSYFLAIVTFAGTAITYQAGFYVGLIKKVFYRPKLETSSLVSSKT